VLLALGLTLLAAPGGCFRTVAPHRLSAAASTHASRLAPARRAAACGAPSAHGRGRARSGVLMMGKKKLKNAASAGLDALEELERQANAAAAAAAAANPAAHAPAAAAAAAGAKGGGGGKAKPSKLKAAALAGLEAIDAAAATDDDEPAAPPPAAVAAVAPRAAAVAAAVAPPAGAPSAAKPSNKAVARAAKLAAKEAPADEADDVAPADASASDADAPPPASAASFEEARARRAPRIAQWADAPEGFALLGLDEVTLRFKDRLLLDKASWEVKTGERVGLVGPNGCGKSTQLRILAEELEPDGGGLVKSSPKLEVAMLRQEFLEQLVGGRTLLQELLSTFTVENALLARNAALEAELAAAGESDASALIDQLSATQRELDAMGAYGLEQRALRLLDTMGFTSADASALVSSFSGGWKMRIGLCKILLLKPQVVLLDEPTNHLDLESVEWLEAFLKAQEKLAIVIVSHDREFLDRVCTKVT
jgi:ABC-type cobalamin/Fe3+-siderophores transport system ATPase subunit